MCVSIFHFSFFFFFARLTASVLCLNLNNALPVCFINTLFHWYSIDVNALDPKAAVRRAKELLVEKKFKLNEHHESEAVPSEARRTDFAGMYLSSCFKSY
jgi:hypothetical protein